ncbi:hypothetical protein [Undibacterium sp. Ren11W]
MRVSSLPGLQAAWDMRLGEVKNTQASLHEGLRMAINVVRE